MFFCPIELNWVEQHWIVFPLCYLTIERFWFFDSKQLIPLQLDRIDLALCYFTLEGFWFFNSKQLFQLDENFLPLCYLTIERFWFFKSKQLILLQLHEFLLPLCYFTIEGFWFFNSKQLILLQLHENFLPLCATSQLKDFGSSIQNNSYFFNSMKIFFHCVLLHNWRILVRRFKTTRTSSTPWKFSSFVCYFTIEGFWFFDSKQLILLQLHENFLQLCATSLLKDFGSSIQNNSYFFNSMKIFFHCVLLHYWRILVLRFKTTRTSSNWIS